MADILNMEKNSYEIPNIQNILSATYYNGNEIINITELLQMFNISGDFYNINKQFTFRDIIYWHNQFNLNILELFVSISL